MYKFIFSNFNEIINDIYIQRTVIININIILPDWYILNI